MAVLNIPILRWGKSYTSLETEDVIHFITGKKLASVSQANTGLLGRDKEIAERSRQLLAEIPIPDLISKMKTAADLYLKKTLPIGDGRQTPDEFARHQSASTGLPEHMCKANMSKNHFVLSNMEEILDALTRGLDLNILTQGYGVEDRGVTVSYQAQTPILGLVLPSNSPGVHTLWLPVIPMQFGLLLKPGPQEPWTPYRMAAAFAEAGIPKEVIGIYPGGAQMGAEVVRRANRSLIFGGIPTVERYRGDPRIQVHGPGFSKILLGDDIVDDWEKYLDIMIDSVFKNSGRGCINCSSIWASRHTKEIAEAIAERIGPVEPKPPEDPEAKLAAFTVPGVAQAIWKSIESGLHEGEVEHVTSKFGSRLVEQERCGYIRPVVIHCDSPEPTLANTEYMFPYVSIIQCPQSEMLEKIGSTLVGSAITYDEQFQRQLLDATHIDRLNLGPVPTIQLDWLQPHEGNIIEFLFRPRAFQARLEEVVV